ncbi:hypothetical protein J6590_060126 [Homalodisca vitripennis]|nr:hypothetical protein J6590_060126 [Homalodisca vitripennis]
MDAGAGEKWACILDILHISPITRHQIIATISSTCGVERKLRGEVRCVDTSRIYLRIRPLIRAGDISTNIG